MAKTDQEVIDQLILMYAIATGTSEDVVRLQIGR